MILRKLKKKFKDEKGFTIIEIFIVVIFIAMVISLSLVGFMSATNANADIIQRSMSEIDSRLTVYEFSKDIREAVEIIDADEDELYFTCNIDYDDTMETVHYYAESFESYYLLKKDVNGSDTKVISDSVINNNIFSYYIDIDDGPLDAPLSEQEKGSIKAIGIDIRIDQSKESSSRTIDMGTLIALRNRI